MKEQTKEPIIISYDQLPVSWSYVGKIWVTLIVTTSIISNIAFYLFQKPDDGFYIFMMCLSGMMNSIVYATVYLLMAFPATILGFRIRPKIDVIHFLLQGLGILIVGVTGYILSSSLINAFTPLQEKATELEHVLIGLVVVIGILIFISIFYTTVLVKHATNLKSQRQQSELIALKSQINPHFLFNTLNSIAALIRFNPKKAEQVVEQLSDVFRYTLTTSERDKVLIEQELEVVKQLLEIEQVRYGDRLKITYDIQAKIHRVFIPSMIIQPLVENAVKHTSKEVENIEITLSIHQSKDRLFLDVFDNGKGFELGQESLYLDKGNGLKNVINRLSLYYGKNYSILLNKKGVSLNLPLEDS